MTMKTAISAAAAAFCLALASGPASAASAVLDQFGGLSLALPDEQWPDSRSEESPAGAGAAWQRVVFDDPAGRSSIVLFATANAGSEFASIEDWIARRELSAFLTWSVGKQDSGDVQRIGSEVSAVSLTADVAAKLVKQELMVNGDTRRAWLLYFADPANRYWYWLGFYSRNGLADHDPALERARKGLAWTSP
jgi:hypothetical protein